MSDLDDIRHARIYLTRAAEHPAPHLHRLVTTVGPVTAADLVRAGDVPADVVAELRDDHRTIRVRDTDFTDPRHGIRVVIPEETDLWPAAQFHTDDVPGNASPWVPPLVLWSRGNATLPDLWARSVSITGSRAATEYGRLVAADLGYHLAERQITVTTGGSFGIEDSAARGTLAWGGRTSAMLACGIDIAHPRAHQALLDRISDNGAVISSFPPGTRPQLHRLAYRASLLAAASQVLVIVESGLRSGSLIAARQANTMRRTVMAVPGPITSAASAGSNRLLRDAAATAITKLDEVGDSLDEALRRREPAPDASC